MVYGSTSRRKTAKYRGAGRRRAFIAPALTYDADHVFLGFTQTAPFASAAITPNEIATATALQAQGLGSPLFEAVSVQTVAGARAAFDALSGEIHPSAVAGAFEDSRLPREAVLDRLASPFDAAGAGALYTYNCYGTDRDVAFPGFADTASAGYGGDTLQAFGEAGWRVPVNGLAGPTFVEPFAGLLAMQIDTAGFAESGGASALNGASQGYDFGATTLGVRGEATVFSNVPLLARGLIGWRHVFGDTTPTSILAVASAPSLPFSIAGAPIARDSMLVEAGFDWRLSANATVGVFYSGELAARDVDNAIKGKLEIVF